MLTYRQVKAQLRMMKLAFKSMPLVLVSSAVCQQQQQQRVTHHQLQAYPNHSIVRTNLLRMFS